MNLNRNSVIVVGILGIAGMEIVALLKGINGVMLSTALVSVSALVGYAFGFAQDRVKSPVPVPSVDKRED